MAQATEKLTAIWQAMPDSLDQLPGEQVRTYLLSRLREIDGELDEIERRSPSAGWWLQRVAPPLFDLDAAEWDPFLYREYLHKVRQSIVAALRTL